MLVTHFPCLSENEFQEACKALQDRSDERIDDTDWINVAWQSGALSIRKLYALKAPAVHDSPEYNDECASTVERPEDSEDDQHTLRRPTKTAHDALVVDFSVILSETYQVPVLWFTIVQAPQSDTKGLDVVYKHLVPKVTHSSLRQIGVMGAISIANHPVSDVPAFFIHPCNTADALREVAPNRHLAPEEYLLLWLGLVGPSVDLHVPSKLLLQMKGNAQ